MYVGEKTNAGNVFDKAGLTNGDNHVLKIPGIATDAAFRAAHNVGDKVPFELREVDWDATGNDQNTEAVTVGGLGFNRMEGGTLELLLDGTEWVGLNKPDNMGIDDRGNIMIQEDPGGQTGVGKRVDLARIVAYRIKDGALAVAAQFDPTLFDPTTAGANLITQDEEASRIIPTDKQFGKNTWLFDAQVHKSAGDTELVERGQLLLLKVKSYKDLYRSGEGDDDES